MGPKKRCRTTLSMRSVAVAPPFPKWLTVAATSQGNQVVWVVLNLVVPWDLFFSYLLSRFKDTLRAVLPAWLDRWYELEALNAHAAFAYLNPSYVLPDVAADAAGRIIASVCHGPAALLSARTPDGWWPFAGRRMTASVS